MAETICATTFHQRPRRAAQRRLVAARRRSVTEPIPRATDGPARRRPRGRRLHDPRRRRDRRPVARPRGALLPRSSRCRRRSPPTCARSSRCCKMVAEVERSADLRCNICKAARRIYGHELDPKLRGIIQRMGDQAQQLYDEAIEAFVDERRGQGGGASTTWTPTSTACRSSSSQAIFESHAGGSDRPAGRRAAGGGRPLLRAHRRPRGEHRRAGALRHHRLAARAQGRARYRTRRRRRHRRLAITARSEP